MKIQIIFLSILLIHLDLICCVKGAELPDDFCRGINTGMFSHPDNCFQFIICNMQVATIYTCPVTTPVFNFTRCVEGYVETCTLGTTTTEQTITTTFPITTTEETTTTQRQTLPPDLCEGKDFLFVADPNYCFRFVFCMSGVADPQECAPNKIFSEELQYCIDGDWVTCDPKTTTVPTTSTTPRLTPSPDICEGNDFLFVPDPNYCFRFYFCNFVTVVPFECLPDTIFSEQSQYCIDGDWDTCEPHTTTTTTQRPTPPPDICDGRDFVFVIDPFYCFRFYFCIFGVASPYECEPDKIFSQESQGCIDGYWDTCEPHTTTTTTQRPTPPPEICDGRDFLFVIDPFYCFRFYFCMFGDAIPYECEPDTIFDEHYQGCIDGDWETCVPHSTTLSTTTTSTTQASPNPCDGVELKFVPDPNYCFRFYFCAFGVASPYECAPDTIFSEQSQGCIDGDWVTCEPKTTTVPTTSTTPRLTPPPDICEGNDYRFVPDPHYCFIFYFCASGEADPQECAPNTIFNETLQYCIDGDWDTCGPLTTTVTTTPIRLPTTTPIPVHRCPPGGFGYIPHHTNCSRYFECIKGIRHMRFCPEGLLFDSVTLQCKSPELAVCAGGK